MALELLDDMVDGVNDVVCPGATFRGSSWEVIEDLDAHDLDLLGHAVVLSANGAGAMGAVALHVVDTGLRASKRWRDKHGALLGSALELLVLLVDAGVEHIGDDTLTLSSIVVLVGVRTRGGNLPVVGDSSEAPRDAVVSYSSDSAGIV